MCETITVVGESAATICTVGELMGLVGAQNIDDIEDFAFDELREDDCLCNVAIADCLVDHGFRVWRGSDDRLRCERT